MPSLRLRPSTLCLRLSVASLAFACGAGLAQVMKREPRTECAAVAPARPADPARAEVSMRDTPKEETEEEDTVFEGRYVNHAYGYSVEIPAGMLGVGSTPPAPQHGFGIDLDNPRSSAWNGAPKFPKSYLYVDGSYNSLFWEQLGDAVKSHLSFLREEGRNVRVQSRTWTRLGGLRAVRVVARYEKDGEEMVNDEVIALQRDADGDASAVHNISLSTPLSKYERDRQTLEALMKSWCLQPVE